MKKIGKKISYFIKVFLVTSLLFNNLSSLSVVFADELDPDTEPEVVVSGEITPETETVSDEVSPDPETEAGVSDGNPEEPSFDANIDDDSNITVNYTGELESINGL